MKQLKIVLWICGIAFLLNFAAMFIPWRVIVSLCEFWQLEVPRVAPFTAYTTRLLQACLGLVGVFLVILATDPLRYRPMLALAGYGGIVLGLVFLVWGVRYGLPAIAFYAKVICWVIVGALILVFRTRAIEEERAQPEQ